MKEPPTAAGYPGAPPERCLICGLIDVFGMVRVHAEVTTLILRQACECSNSASSSLW